jgi:hypothetical protein
MEPPEPAQPASGTIKSWHGEAACGLAIIVTGAFFAIGGYRMSLFEDGVPGPGLVPFIAGLILALLGGIIAVTTLSGNSQAQIKLFDRDSMLAAILMLLAIAAFEYAGYLISTFTFLWAAFVFIGREKPLVAGLVAAGATLMTWAMFVKALGVGLPAGILPLPF